MEGSDVLVLQNLINRNDVLSKKVQITSIYDNETAEAVKEFQKNSPRQHQVSLAQAKHRRCLLVVWKMDTKTTASRQQVKDTNIRYT